MCLDGLWHSNTGRKEGRSGTEVWTWDLHVTEFGCCNPRYFVQILFLCARFEGPTGKTIAITLSWDVNTCSQIKIHRCFEWIFCLHHPKVGKFLPDDTALLPRRRQISFVRVIGKESNCAFVNSKYGATRISIVCWRRTINVLATCPHMTCGQNVHVLTPTPLSHYLFNNFSWFIIIY